MLSPSASSRRRLLKRFALGALAFPVGGELAHDLFLTELEAAVLPTTATIRLSLQEFPSLQSEMGSLRLGVNPVGFDHFPQGTFYPILINRGLGTTFHALSAECRHASCVVDAMMTSFKDSSVRVITPCMGLMVRCCAVRRTRG